MKLYLRILPANPLHPHGWFGGCYETPEEAQSPRQPFPPGSPLGGPLVQVVAVDVVNFLVNPETGRAEADK